MDRSLATLIRSLQTSNSYEDASRLLPTATSLLTRLTNPLNITLLSSQLLSHPSLYPHPIELSICRRIFGIFYSAAVRISQDQTNAGGRELHHLPVNAWAKAVVQGADDTSPRWRHVLLLGGIFLGFEGQQQHNLSSDLRSKLELALVTASNLALEELERVEQDSRFCVVFVLNHTFAILSDFHRTQLNYDLFLPLAIDATLFSREGLEHGYWLDMIDGDIKETLDRKFSWSSKSTTFRKVQSMKSNVLVSSLGILSRLIAHSIENVKDSSLVIEAVDRLADFGRTVAMSWRKNKLSEIETSEEAVFLDEETLRVTLPLLWQILRDVLFAVVVLLRAALGRMLCDPFLSSDSNSPLIAMQGLHILRHINFISSRFGQSSNSQYLFVNFTALDVLNRYRTHSENFLHAIRPTELGQIPSHPLDRSYDLFFLNTSEHLTLTVSPTMNEELLLASATPYVVATGNRYSSDIYEAAHSVFLAVFASPLCADIASKHLPFYLEAVLQSFPKDLSPRQFRLAIKSIMRISAPPSRIGLSLPNMQSVMLELLQYRAAETSADILQASKDLLLSGSSPAVSEQSVLVMSMIDSLPTLPVVPLQEWLPLTASSINKITDPPLRSACQQRLWEVLSNGEMDVERAAVCVAWWGSRGGRELLLYNEELGDDDDEYAMSGALQQESKL